MAEGVRLFLLDFAVVVGITLIPGATAPRWPRRWLQRDVGPLRLTSFDRVAWYRSLRIGPMSRWLPEFGEVFGGTSKRRLPGTSQQDLENYCIEVRRAEWVHWISFFSWVPVAFFNPLWVTVLVAVAVMAINLAFLMILRYNKLRVGITLAKMTAIRPA